MDERLAKKFEPTRLCLRCMEPLWDGNGPSASLQCSVCGLPVGFGNTPRMLRSGTFLAGRYFVGNSADGYGPIKWFGPMGYIGYDIPKEKKVLI